MIPAVRSQTEVRFIHDTNSESLVFIKATRQNANGTSDVYTGTGFIVASEGYVLTCSHLIPGGDRDRTKLTGAVGSRYKPAYPLEFVDWDNLPEGLALLKLPEMPGTTWTSVKSAAKVERGDEIVALGFPADKDLVDVSGKITGKEINGRLLTDAAVSEGMSGGPVFDRSGQVVGIVYGGYPDTPAAKQIIPIRYAANLLRLTDSPLSQALASIPSPTPIPAPAPPAHPQTGARELVIKTNTACDLQGGQVLENANDNQCDFRWLAQSDGKRFLEPSSSSSVFINLQNRVSWDTMSELSVRSYSESVGTTFRQRQTPTRTTLSPGDLCIYRTRDGGYGKFKVESCESDLRIEFITYYTPKVSQAPPNSGDITVRSNRFYNLDDGQEANGSEATFEWYYREDIKKGLLIPNNLSKFAFMGVGSDFFNNLSLSTIKSLLDTVAQGQIRQSNGSSFNSTTLIPGNVYGYCTSSGLYGKLLINSVAQDVGVTFATFHVQ